MSESLGEKREVERKAKGLVGDKGMIRNGMFVGLEVREWGQGEGEGVRQ